MTTLLDELGIPPVGLGLWKIAPEDTAHYCGRGIKRGLSAPR